MKKNLSMKVAIPVMAVILILLIILKASGLFPICSSTSVGFLGNDGIHTFNGSYKKITGTMTHTLKPSKDSAVVHCEITTKTGTLHVTITQQGDDKVLCDRDIQCDETFDIPADGKVKVQLSTEEHSGSYLFKY